jgi:hypothetical protein
MRGTNLGDLIGIEIADHDASHAALPVAQVQLEAIT